MSVASISKPEVTFNIIPGQEEISNAPQRVLFVGQKTPSGSASSGDLVESIPNDGSEDALFGEDSMLAGMVRAYKALNQVTVIDAIPLDDNGSAVDATGTVVVSGTATEDGTLEVTTGSDQNHKFTIAVSDTDTATVIGAAIEAAVNADTSAPVTAANVAGTVTMTAVNGGTVGNGITLRITGTVAGITPSVTGMTGGATDPVLTSVFDVIGDERYQTIVAPSEYGTDFLTDLLDPRFNATNKVLDGVGIITQTGSFATLLSNGNAENSQTGFVIIGNQSKSTSTFEGSVMVELDQVISAQFAANRAERLTEGANISNIVIATSGPLDSFGGKEIASLPYFNTPFPNLPLIALGDGFDSSEEASLNAAGITLLGNNIARTSIISGEVVTTRKTDAAGNPELTFRFLNALDTSSVIREFYFNNNRARFAQSRLTTGDGDLVPNRSIANESVIRGFQISLYNSLSGLLTQSGEDALNFYKENLTVSLDILSGQVTITMKTPIVGQLREILGTIQIVFSTNN
jgi:phage tail sheath gpL-like